MEVLGFLPRPDSDARGWEGVSSWTLGSTDIVQGVWETDDGLWGWAVWSGSEFVGNGLEDTRRDAVLTSRRGAAATLAIRMTWEGLP